MKLVTVFTPTYNREHTLPQLYDSLCRQTCKDFVWCIVDDGSKDNTEELVQEWVSKNQITIEYHKQSNGGKMRAHNFGVRLCKTPLFVCIDSDDYVSDTFVESVKGYYPQIKDEAGLAGIIAYRTIKQEDGTFRVKCKFPYSGKSTLTALYKGGFFGDTTLVFKSEVIKQYPNTEMQGRKPLRR